MSKEAIKRWTLGLIGAAINSAASAISVVIADPHDFNPFEGGIQKLATVMITSAIVGAGLYIRQHPVTLEELLDEVDAKAEAERLNG